ncbi:MAG: hypothetical protein JWR61_3388 [Ferruginibacter sp.]|uniref:ORC-CDC6 family AAA ATPase n=1 Tax=Ferruginibacter sp. TaxID=1940288 RepID=UPI00265A7481|nr:hypothetical protein [Ferruginibacter sp.]MDB5278433.1 hypothetical protein [Ferruginibacter sp.]
MKSKRPTNPFEYEAAVNFATDELIEYFVEDHNYSRFIQSGRNIFIVGERGCGKSMTLLYNSYQKQFRKAAKDKVAFDYSKLGIYIPCTNALFFKKEYELINNPFKVSVLSEHFFVLAIAFELSNVLSTISDICSEEEEQVIRQDLDYILNIKLPSEFSVFKGLVKYFQKLNSETQNQINNSEDSFSDRCVSFYSLIIPLVRIIKSIDKLDHTHFLLLIDDAHDLNSHQIRALNSWIAYRDHSDFSFKVAVAKVRKHTYVTATGSSILEGHDFLKIDMEKPFQNKFSDFGLWAKDIIERRLEKYGVGKIEATTFFPTNPSVDQDLIKYKEIVKKKAEAIYTDLNDPKRQKKIDDYVYKYHRAEYFRNRPAKANLPHYAGWETVVHLSTGVVRNLLYPCYWMYDKEYSTLLDELKEDKENIKVKHIRPSYQDEVIKEKSQELWDRIKNDLFNNIQDCSTKQGIQIKSLFDNLVLLFKERLSSEVSEPRAIMFSISAMDKLNSAQAKELEDLLRISKEAQILYDRESTAKDAGERETYYVPNRLLFPIRGLDVVGQHARVSIKAIELYKAAIDGKAINSKEVLSQKTLFDHEM